jgi:hypothetical protein
LIDILQVWWEQEEQERSINDCYIIWLRIL